MKYEDNTLKIFIFTIGYYISDFYVAKTNVHKDIRFRMFMRVQRMFYPVLRVPPGSLICTGKLWKNYLIRKIIPDEMRSTIRGRSKRDWKPVKPTFRMI
jgi:hypothetical protein